MATAGWQYLVVTHNVDGFFGPDIDPAQINDLLDQQGSKGWELVNTVDVN